MGIPDQAPLFQRIALAEVALQTEAAARAAVERVAEADIMRTAGYADLATRIVEALSVNVPVLSEHYPPRPFIQEGRAGERFGSALPVARHYVELVVPFTGDGAALQIRPQSYRFMTAVSGKVEGKAVQHIISTDRKSLDQTADDLKVFLRELTTCLEALRADVRAFETQLRHKVVWWLEERHGKLLDLQSVSFELDQKLKP
jgi:hypothetical protein